MKKHFGGKKFGNNRGKTYLLTYLLTKKGQILAPNELDLTFWVTNYGAKFHQNLVRIATVREVADRQTDRRG